MWWQSLSSYQQVMFIIAVSATAVMVVFLILMLIGMDNTDFDGVTDGLEDGLDLLNDEPLTGIAGLKILTVRGVLVFLSIGAWTAFLFENFLSFFWASLFGVILGLIAMYLQALAFRAMMKLESIGNMNYENAIGKTGTVYIRIPKEKSGKGKINVVIQETYAEVDAMTESNEDLMPKTVVEVVGLENPTTVIVKKK